MVGRKLIDLTGQTFGLWTVKRRIKIEGRKDTIWECECRCGQIKHVSASHLTRSKSKSCGCNLRKGRKHSQWNGHGDISGNYWDGIKRGALGKKGNRRQLVFDITIEYAWKIFLEQDKKCALTGIPLVINFARKTGPIHNASLDRIDNAKGYIQGNIQWVHKDINMMKRNYDQEYFISLCQQVAQYRG